MVAVLDLSTLGSLKRPTPDTVSLGDMNAKRTNDGFEGRSGQAAAQWRTQSQSLRKTQPLVRSCLRISLQAPGVLTSGGTPRQLNIREDICTSSAHAVVVQRRGANMGAHRLRGTHAVTVPCRPAVRLSTRRSRLL
jgi:hypothetical protein